MNPKERFMVVYLVIVILFGAIARNVGETLGLSLISKALLTAAVGGVAGGLLIYFQNRPKQSKNQ